MKEFEVKNHVSSIVPEGEWELVWADEFDGTELDRTKWGFRLSMMGKKHRTWGEEGVHLDGNSNVVFTVYEKDGEICSSQLQTGCNYMDAVTEGDGALAWQIGKFGEQRFLKKYGYFECRCKLQKKPGWWSAFWVQSPTIGTSPYPEKVGIENDIMECFEPGKVISHYNHFNGYGADHDQVISGDGAELDVNEYHTFGMLWDEDGYTFYIDGKEDGHTSSPVSHVPEFILISTEVNGYRDKENTATAEARAAVGDEFIVDYVRVFDRIKGDFE